MQFRGFRMPFQGVGSAFMYPEGVLGSLAVAVYDAVRQGGNPQLLTWSDDPTAGDWYTALVDITTGIDDPDGGNNAWTLETDGVGVSDYAGYSAASTGKACTLLVKMRARNATSTGGYDASFWLRSDGTPTTPPVTISIVSGPGSATGGSIPYITGLSSSEWTTVMVSMDSDPPTASETISPRIYPGKNGLGEAAKVDIYRPTVQLGNHDGRLYKSTATVPALVTQLDDHGPHGYHQTITAGSEPIYVADAGDGLPAWYYDGTAKTDGVAITSVSLPGYKWTCQNFSDLSGNRYVESGVSAAADWVMYKNTTPLFVFGAGLNGSVPGAPAQDLFEWWEARYDSAEGEGWRSGVGGGQSVNMTESLTGIRTGSSYAGGNNMLGYIRSTITCSGTPTAAQIASIDAIMASYARGLPKQYYVSSVHPSASDSNAGTDQSLPWSTFAKVMSEWDDMTDGSTVHLDQGSEWTWTGDNTVYWTISSGGSAGLPITIRGDTYDSGNGTGKPKLRHTGAAVAGGGVIEVTASYVTVRDFTLDNDFGGFTGVRIAAASADVSYVNVLNMTIEEIGDYDIYACGIWLSTVGGSISDCLIQGNDISDHVMVGINSYASSENAINNCTFRDNRVYGHNAVLATSGPPGAVQQVRGGTGNVWEYNYFEDSVSPRVWMSNLANTTGSLDDETTIRYNIFRGGVTTGAQGLDITVGTGSGSTIDHDIYGNFFYDHKNYALYLRCGPDVVGGTINIYNNTFYANYPSGTWWDQCQMRIADTGADVDVKNNLFHNTPAGANGGGLEISSTFADTLTHSNNHFWSDSGSAAAAVRDNRPTSTTYAVSAVTTWEPTAQNTDPDFVDVSTPPTAVTQAAGATPDGLEVQVGSDAIDNGADLGTDYNEDINGVTRTTYDIGATEYVP